MSQRWTDNRLTVACRYGFTLIYDEFTRSRPEANNVLLSVLQEKMLDLPAARDGEGYLRVHPDFTAIFTSNPEEYAGVYRSQDALRDRMITLDLDFFDEETEIGITEAKSRVEKADAERIVRIVRALRESGVCEFAPTIRGCIMVGKALKVQNGSVDGKNDLFRQVDWKPYSPQPEKEEKKRAATTVTRRVNMAGVCALSRRLMAIERARALGRKPVDLRAWALEQAGRRWAEERAKR